MTEQQEYANTSLLRNIDERILLGLLATAVLVGFFIFDIFSQSILTQFVRVVLIVAAFLLIYLVWPGSIEEEVEDQTDEPDEQAAVQHLVDNTDPVSFFPEEEKMDFYEELGQFFGNLVKMVRATFVAHSAIIFMWDGAEERLRVDFCESQSNAIQQGDFVDVKGTLPGSVLVNQTAVLEQNIPDEGQSINYYHDLKGIKSFLAVPIDIKDEVQGVLAVDSMVAHDFSEEDLELLKSYERLISQGIDLIGVRERSQLVNQSLMAQRIFLSELNEDLSYESLYSSVGSACRAVYQFDRLTIAAIDSESSEMGVITKVIGQRDNMSEGFRFALGDGISGWVIRKNQPLMLGDLEKGELFRPRYSGRDKSNFGLRSFLGVPVAFRNQIFGMISLESKQPEFYTEWDQNVMMLLAANVGLAFLSLRLLPNKV